MPLVDCSQKWSAHEGQICVPGDEELYNQQIKLVDRATVAYCKVKTNKFKRLEDHCSTVCSGLA